jgi:thioredoxin-like negative regulator of GroEL
MKEADQVEGMIKKYLYKSHGKFRLALIDIDDNQAITSRSVPVSPLH